MGANKEDPLKVREISRCPFCGENNLHIKRSRRRHVERHMEEVAFAVVSKPYEEWDFCSDVGTEYIFNFHMSRNSAQKDSATQAFEAQ